LISLFGNNAYIITNPGIKITRGIPIIIRRVSSIFRSIKNRLRILHSIQNIRVIGYFLEPIGIKSISDIYDIYYSLYHENSKDDEQGEYEYIHSFFYPILDKFICEFFYDEEA